MLFDLFDLLLLFHLQYPFSMTEPRVSVSWAFLERPLEVPGRPFRRPISGSIIFVWLWTRTEHILRLSFTYFCVEIPDSLPPFSFELFEIFLNDLFVLDLFLQRLDLFGLFLSDLKKLLLLFELWLFWFSWRLINGCVDLSF